MTASEILQTILIVLVGNVFCLLCV